MTNQSALTSTKRAHQGRRKVGRSTSISAKGRLNSKRLRLLRRSFAQIQRQGEIAGLIFYQTLFRSEPSLKSLFQTSIDLQSRKLMESLSYAIATLEDPNTLIPVLEALGRRHVVYGVRDHHYDLVTRALIETFREILGNSFTHDLHEAWKQTLDFVANTMKQGAARYPGANGSIQG